MSDDALRVSTERPAANCSARRMLSRMSDNASRAQLESIKRVAFDARPDERLQAAAVGDVNADREQVSEVLRNPDVFEKPDGRLRVELNQNIDVARTLALITCDGAE